MTPFYRFRRPSGRAKIAPPRTPLRFAPQGAAEAIGKGEAVGAVEDVAGGVERGQVGAESGAGEALGVWIDGGESVGVPCDEGGGDGVQGGDGDAAAEGGSGRVGGGVGFFEEGQGEDGAVEEVGEGAFESGEAGEEVGGGGGGFDVGGVVRVEGLDFDGVAEDGEFALEEFGLDVAVLEDDGGGEAEEGGGGAVFAGAEDVGEAVGVEVGDGEGAGGGGVAGDEGGGGDAGGRGLDGLEVDADRPAGFGKGFLAVGHGGFLSSRRFGGGGRVRGRGRGRGRRGWHGLRRGRSRWRRGRGGRVCRSRRCRRGCRRSRVRCRRCP